MTVLSRGFLIGALSLILLSTSCNLPAFAPTPTGTLPQIAETISPTVSSTDTLIVSTSTALIPVTGVDEVSLQCEFCVNDEPHAVLIMSENAQFYVSDTTARINCVTAQLVNKKRILLCRGTQQASFNLNVCAENTNCLQYPVVLETCAVIAKTSIATPIFLTPVNTAAPPTLQSTTLTPIPTQTVPIQPSAAATTAIPLPANTQPVVATVTPIPPQSTGTLPPPMATLTHSPQSRGTPLPATRLPRSGLFDPEGFVRWYFEAVWRERNYQDLWDNFLTPAFKSRTSSSNFSEYITWWDSVDRVDMNSVNVLQNDGTHAWVRVNITFNMKDGRIISNQEYDYDLLFDPTRQTWMFDYHTQ